MEFRRVLFRSPDLTYLPALISYLISARPTVLLSALSYANLLAVWARLKSKVPFRVVISERIDPRYFSKKRKWRTRFLGSLMRRYYPRADVILAVSEGVADGLANWAGLPRNRILAVYNQIGRA